MSGWHTPGMILRRATIRARINSDVFVQDFRADGDRFKGGNLKRFILVDVDGSAHNVGYRVNLCVRSVGDRQSFFRLVRRPRSVVVAPARVPVKRLAGEREWLRLRSVSQEPSCSLQALWLAGSLFFMRMGSFRHDAIRLASRR